MKPEEKDLLLKDLCARLPYNVNVNYKGETLTMFTINTQSVNGRWTLDYCKPYLRPMSSMTEEEKHKLLKFGAVTCLENGEVIDVSCIGFERHADIQDYLNARYFDYRGLISMGLALEAPEGMYIIPSSKSDSMPIIELPKSEDNKSNGWTLIRDGMYMDKDGHIIGGLKIK